MQLLFCEHVSRTIEWIKENVTKIVGLGWNIAVNVKGMRDMLYKPCAHVIQVSGSADATSNGKPGYATVGSTPP